MPKLAKELAAYEIKRIASPGMHAVGGVAGLHLNIKDSGAKSWILRVKIGRRMDLGLGAYPEVSLAKAREKAAEARDQLARGIDPRAARRDARAALAASLAKQTTFLEAARLCHARKAREFRNVKHRRQWIATIETYVPEAIAALPVGAFNKDHVLQVLAPLWETKPETASRLRGRIEDVIDYATVVGLRAGENPARWAGHLEHALPRLSKVKQVKHHPALPIAQAPKFAKSLADRSSVSARALLFMLMTAARSGEVRGATWSEINFKTSVWTIPGSRMKAGKTHRVPLTAAAVKLLKELPRFEDCDYVFPGPKLTPLSDNTLGKLMREIRPDCVPHGLRSTFKDWCRLKTKYADEVSELQLAHVNSDVTRSAYARDELLDLRRKLMNQWSKYLGGAK